MQAAFWQKAVNIGDTPVGRIFDGQHSQIGFSVANSGQNVLESQTWNRFGVGACLKASFVAVGTQGTLKGNTLCHFVVLKRQIGPILCNRAIGRGNYT
jgi:hypothetical protein